MGWKKWVIANKFFLIKYCIASEMSLPLTVFTDSGYDEASFCVVGA